MSPQAHAGHPLRENLSVNAIVDARERSGGQADLEPGVLP